MRRRSFEPAWPYLTQISAESAGFRSNVPPDLTSLNPILLEYGNEPARETRRSGNPTTRPVIRGIWIE